MTAPLSPARQRILNVASDLFYREGIRSVGIDTIIAQSGVAKATLYRHFPTKDDLVAAYLEDQDHVLWRRYDKAIAAHEGDPRAQLLAMMEAVAQRLTEPEYRGCAFLIALTEFPEGNHPTHQHAIEHKRVFLSRLYHLSQQAGASDPEALAEQLFLLVNGALSTVPVCGSAGPVARFKMLSRHLIELYAPSVEH